MTFDPGIYEVIRDGIQRSAKVVVPDLYDLFMPDSVIDVGGGEGWWGRAFWELGADVLVVDETIDELGWEHYDGRHTFWGRRVDLTDPPLIQAHADADVDIRRWDVALCLEVAEHIDEAHSSQLIDWLTDLAPIVVFSAAVPGQGGHGHVNEQWPAYWVEHFERCGFQVSGALRWRYWGNENVEPWYQQNLLVAANPNRIDPDDWNHAGNVLFGEHAFDDPIAVVHPVTFTHHVELGKARR